ncbi:MAG: GIY-YIG nuclease family protein [Candidatus Poribacteria bacterium]|nr:GIY-YIG nuclease family protein [Candidatus Poribacteria bacterium]
MIDFSPSSIPKKPGIYAIYDQSKKLVYVGHGKDLRNRITNHIIRQDSSVTTGASATVLNPEKISHIRWWLHEEFADEDRRKAAEFIASKVLNPVLRSRSNVEKKAKTILKDRSFCEKMELLFDKEPPEAFYPKTFDNLANLVLELHERVSKLEKQLKT